MPSNRRKYSGDLTFTTLTIHGKTERTDNLEEALSRAANCSMALGGKHTTVQIWAETPKGAEMFGGSEAVQKLSALNAGEPLATINVKVYPPSYWK